MGDEDIQAMLPKYGEILHQNDAKNKFDYDNFLSPSSIQ